MLTTIVQFVEALNTDTIPENRKEILQPLIDFIALKREQNKPIDLNFICTHNSRRSHLSQVWAQVLSNFYDIKQVTCYSGGTEATALFPKAAEALTKSGLEINKLADSNNPIYSIKYDDNAHPIIAFSKTYDDAFNPKSNFAAILTCSSADKGCPFIAGAEKRIPVTYKDPKAFDNTDLQEEKYLERSTQIATEMKYIFKQVSTK